MAFGDLVKSLIVRFTVENFEETKLELDDIGARAEALKHELDMKATLDDGDLWAKLELLRIQFKSMRDAGVKDFSEIALAAHALGDEVESTALKVAALQLAMSATSATESGGIGSSILMALASPAALSGSNYLAMGIGAALVPIVSELSSIIPAVVAATGGVAAFGLLAYPTFTKIYDAVTGVSGAMGSLDPAQKKIVTGIQGLEGEFGKLAGKLEPVVTQIAGIAVQIAQKLLPALLPFAQVAGKALEPLLKDFDKFVTSKGFHQFEDLMLKLEGPAITAIGQGIGKLGGAVGKFLEDLSNPASARILADVFTALADLVATVGWVFKQVNNHVSEIISDFERLYDNISHYVDDAWQAVNHAFDNVMHAFDNVQHAGDVFSSDLANVLKRVAGDVQNWAGDVNTWLNKAVSWFEQLPGKIVSALGALPGMLFSAGQHAVSSLISGLQSMIPSLGSVALSMASKVAGFFGLSPAKEGPLSGSGAPEIRGAHLVDAIGAGMLSRTGALAAAARGVASSAGMAGGYAGSGAGGGAVRVQLEWVGGGSEQEIFSYLKRHIRARGGNPGILGA